MEQLCTVFGEGMDKSSPLKEHPNPMFQRRSFVSLNGPWAFKKDKCKDKPASFSSHIIVPFAVETQLSDVNESVRYDDYLHYQKEIDLPDDFVGNGLLIHFDAIDQIADVWVNGFFEGHHEGGYSPLVVFIQYAKKHTVIDVLVKDDSSSPIYPRGKQSDSPQGSFHTSTSGIYGNVWLESVPSDGYIESISIMPDYDKEKLHVKATFAGIRQFSSIEAYYRGQLVARTSFDYDGVAELDFKYDFYPWSPENPNIYSLSLSSGDDVVSSYFAFRKINLVDTPKGKCLSINDKPFFASGVLYQGYFPESGLIPPSDSALINDLTNIKKAGFNMVRVYQNVEPLRFYYHCDKIGLLVNQDIVAGGSFSSPLTLLTRPFLEFNFLSDANNRLGKLSAKSRERFVANLKENVGTLKNFPCLFMWTLFSEGMGQFDTQLLTDTLKAMDQGRLVDSAAGFYDKKCGDFMSRYGTGPLKSKADKKRALLLYVGAYSFKVKDHVTDESFSFSRHFLSYASLNSAYRSLYLRKIVPLVEEGKLAAVVFREYSDVEEETDGLFTYDRKILKADMNDVKNINADLFEAFSHAHSLK